MYNEMTSRKILMHSDPLYPSTSTFSILADNYRAGLLTPEIIVILFTQGNSYFTCK